MYEVQFEIDIPKSMPHMLLMNLSMHRMKAMSISFCLLDEIIDYHKDVNIAIKDENCWLIGNNGNRSP
jgi:hypothetical protein